MSQVAVITGVSSGLGHALAEFFKKQGVLVAGVSRSRPDIELDLWIQADVTIPEDREKILRETQQTFGHIDLLLNNAGKGIYSTWEEMPEQDLKEVFELDFFAPVALTKSFLPALKESQGTIINISSTAARLWVPCMGGYCAAKAATAMFSDTLRIELKRYGVHVLDVKPGQISTGFSSRALGERKPPRAPGAKSNTDAFVRSVFRAWQKRKNILYYPASAGIAIELVRCFMSRLYDSISLRLWHLK